MALCQADDVVLFSFGVSHHLFSFPSKQECVEVFVCVACAVFTFLTTNLTRREETQDKIRVMQTNMAFKA